MSSCGEYTDNASKLGKMNDEIIRTLECPACLNIMLSAIYVCMTGHSICESCWTVLTHCPLCENELASTRNYTLESIAASAYYPCDNKEFGCDKVFIPAEIDTHARICRYKKYQCKISSDSCTFEGRLDALEQHIYQAHQLQVAQGADNSFVWRSDVQPESSTHLIVLQKEELFYVYRFVKNEIMYWVAQYLGNCEEDDVQFTFKVSIRNRTKKYRRFITISEYCIDNSTDDMESIVDASRCVAIPMSIINSYKIQNVVRYQVDIRLCEL